MQQPPSSLGHGYGFETPTASYRLEAEGPASIAFRAAHQGVHDPVVTGLPFIDGLLPIDKPRAPPGLYPGAVLELYGPSGSGKTEVVLGIIASYVLPKRLDGLGRSVVILDLDFRLSIARLEALVLAKLGDGEDQDGTVLRDCLSRVLIARCFDEVEVLATLETVRGHAPRGEPFLLVVDSLAPLYYSSKMAECCRSERSALHNSVYRAVARLASQHAATVLATKPCLLQPKRLHDGLGPHWEHRDFMPKLWRGLVTHRLDLFKEEAPPSDDPGLDATSILARGMFRDDAAQAPSMHHLVSARTAVFRVAVGQRGVEACDDLQALARMDEEPQ